MATIDDVRTIALSLPDTIEKPAWGNDTWRVGGKMFVWDRPLSKTDRAELGDAAPEGPLIGLYTGDMGEKQAILAGDPAVFLTITHFDQHPMVLARLDELDAERLREVVVDAWLARAPEKLAREYLAE